jgi:hypothetical protein
MTVALSSYMMSGGVPTLPVASGGTGGATAADARTNLGVPASSSGTITSLRETKTAPSISSGTLTLDCSTGNVFAVSLNASITTLTFSNVPSSGNAYCMVLEFTADGTARTVAWGSAVKWAGGSAPTLTSANGKRDAFTLLTYDGGTTWLASILGQNF